MLLHTTISAPILVLLGAVQVKPRRWLLRIAGADSVIKLTPRGWVLDNQPVESLKDMLEAVYKVGYDEGRHDLVAECLET